jgi:hypothetical protein
MDEVKAEIEASASDQMALENLRAVKAAGTIF